MRGIDITGLSMRRQLNLVEVWLSNRYGSEVVTNALAEPAPFDAAPVSGGKGKPVGSSRRMTKEQAERIAHDMAEYDTKAAKGQH